MNEEGPRISLEDLAARSPNLTAILGLAWMQGKGDWCEEFIPRRLAWFDQLERDLAILESHVGSAKLLNCYRAPLRTPKEIQKAIYEVHAAALLATAATKVDVHVPRGDGSGKNFDVQAEIQGRIVSADSKTRKDEFPFNLPADKPDDELGVPSYGGVRETVDRHDAVDFGIELQPRGNGLHRIETPESTVIRQLLIGAQSQLPQDGLSLVVLGHIEGDRHNVEDALFGAKVFQIHRNLTTREATCSWSRVPNGAFCDGPAGEPFRSLGAVLWVRLWPDDNTLGRAYKLYANPCASTPYPDVVLEAIGAAIKQWQTPTESELSTETENP